MKRSLLFLLLGFFSISLFAQSPSYRITGTVTDDAGEPLGGTAIVNVVTNEGVFTDFEGKFELLLSHPQGELEVRYIGYRSQTIEYDLSKKKGEALSLSLSMASEIISCGPVYIEAFRSLSGDDVICSYPFRTNNTDRNYNPYLISGSGIGRNSSGNWMSQPDIIQSAVPGFYHLNDPQNRTNWMLRTQGSPQTFQPGLMLNGMPLDSRTEGLYQYLWEDVQGNISLHQNPSLLTNLGTSGLGGAIHFTDEGPPAQGNHLVYQGMGGTSLAGDGFRMTTHQLKGATKSIGNWSLVGGLGLSQQGGGLARNQWSLLRGNVQGAYQGERIRWQGNLRGAQMESPGGPQQIAIGQQKLLWKVRQGMEVELRQLALGQRQDTSSLQTQQVVQAIVRNQFERLDDLKVEGGYEYVQWSDLENQSFRIKGAYKFLRRGFASVQARRGQLKQNGRLNQTQSISGGVGWSGREFACVPSRGRMELQSGWMQAGENRVWRNQLLANLYLTDGIKIGGDVQFNRFLFHETQALGLHQWRGEGRQQQWAMTFRVEAKHYFRNSLQWLATGYYAYNRPFLGQFQDSPILNARQGGSFDFSGQEQLPRGMWGSTQQLRWRNVGFQGRLWAWTGDPLPNQGPENGLRLQEVRTWYQFNLKKSKSLRQLTFYLQGENLLHSQQADENHFQTWTTDASLIPQTRNLLLGMEMKLF